MQTIIGLLIIVIVALLPKTEYNGKVEDMLIYIAKPVGVLIATFLIIFGLLPVLSCIK